MSLSRKRLVVRTMNDPTAHGARIRTFLDEPAARGANDTMRGKPSLRLRDPDPVRRRQQLFNEAAPAILSVRAAAFGAGLGEAETRFGGPARLHSRSQDRLSFAVSRTPRYHRLRRFQRGWHLLRNVRWGQECFFLRDVRDSIGIMKAPLVSLG